MSAVPPVQPVDRHSPNFLGFNDHSSYDPFLSSSTSEEHLLGPPSDVSRSYHSHSASASPQPSDLSGAASETVQAYPPSVFDLSPKPSLNFSSPGANELRPFQDEPSSSFHAASGYGRQRFLSPRLQTSDNGYTDTNDYTTNADLGDITEPDTDFSFLNDPDLQASLAGIKAPTQHKPSDPESATTNKSYDSNITHKISLGTATHSSTLLSPVLTDRASPLSRDGQSSPRIDTAYHPGASPGYQQTSNIGESTDHYFYAMQQTPTLTSSSKGTSPDRMTRPQTARTTSPVVRIENYTRGDSPDRPTNMLGRTPSKRSHGSRSPSHLMVQDDGGSSVDDGNEPSYFRTGQVQGSGNLDLSVDERFNDRAGLDPASRLDISSVEVPNFQEQEEAANVASKNADVADWLSSRHEEDAEAVKHAPTRRPRRTSTSQQRRRARSTGDHMLSQGNLQSLQEMPADIHIPGPGVLINEESGDDDDDESVLMSSDQEDMPESPPTTAHNTQNQDDRAESDELGSLDPPPLYRLKFWQDPVYDSSDPGVRMQPPTANSAIMKWQMQVKDTDALSRVATWGTRRMSESDLSGLLHRFTFGKGESNIEGRPERQGSFFDQVKATATRTGSLLRRSGSRNSRQQASKPTMPDLSKQESHGSRKESLGLPTTLQRVSSLGKRPKSPRVDTGSAVAAMASVASLGAGAAGPISATTTSPSATPWTSPRNVVKRPRSRSELGDLWTKQGGPPMPTLAAPKEEPPTQVITDPIGEFEEDEDVDLLEGKGVTIDLAPRFDPIIPNLEGFRSNARQLNPRLPTYMIDRVSQEQLRRYKKLLDFKVRHAQAIKGSKCASGKHCLALGGEPTYLPSKANLRDSELANTGFSVSGLGESDEDANALAEGLVTPAQFPPGVPMPPIKRLPAEFECSLCFKVKKFHKPSDWSKHVHEDVQPFTCTFANCADPKSFKRKADWVRHENERHRQLEWWICSMHDCAHKCFRKDNFVQHLVREHKLPEPKLKTAKASKPAVRGPSSQKARKRLEEEDSPVDEIDHVWRLVDECRHETPKDPRDEPCKFCGNVCNSWKKLTVHLARHMEQIAMPVLNLAKERDVSPETIISPIEQKAPQNKKTSPPFTDQFSPDRVSGTIYPVSDAFYYSPSAQSQRHPQAQKTDTQANPSYRRPGLATYPPTSMPPPSHAGSHQQMVNPYAGGGYAQYPDSAAPTYQAVSETGPAMQTPVSRAGDTYHRGETQRTRQSHAPLFPVGDPYPTYTSQPFHSPTEAPMYGYQPGSSQPYPPPGVTVHYNQMGEPTYIPAAEDPGMLYGSGVGQGPGHGQGYGYP